MKFLVFIFVSTSAFAATPAEISFERFSYELAKSNSAEARLDSLDSYKSDLALLGKEVAKPDACLRNLFSNEGAKFCVPEGFNAMFGGTGGVQ